MYKIKYFGIIVGILFTCFSHAESANLICLTGKLELMLPNYKTAFLNAVDLAVSNHPASKNVRIKTYFFDTKPLAAIQAYHEMIHDHCSVIVGFEYLSDLLLVAKIQKDNKIPIFASYASSNDQDRMPENIFMFMPTYDFHAKKMMGYLHAKFEDLNKVLIVTEVDRTDLYKYKKAYENIFLQEKTHYETLDFVSNDEQFEQKLVKFIENKKYNFVFVLAGAVGSTKIVNIMNDHKTTFIGTENFGSSTNQSLYVRLQDKKISAFLIRNLDLLKSNDLLKKFTHEYVKKYSIDPFPLSVYTYDALMIIFQTIEKHGTVTVNNILKNNYAGISGAKIENKKFHRSNQQVILGIKEDGFFYEE